MLSAWILAQVGVMMAEFALSFAGPLLFPLTGGVQAGHETRTKGAGADGHVAGSSRMEYRMISCWFDGRATSTKPALRKAEAMPV